MTQFLRAGIWGENGHNDSDNIYILEIRDIKKFDLIGPWVVWINFWTVFLERQ